jgi:hypothetical protein
MDRRTLAIVILSISAVILLAIGVASEPKAQAAMAVQSREYQAATAKAQQGGEALYILDNKTGQMAVFLYDTRDRQLRLRDLRMVRDAFNAK